MECNTKLAACRAFFWHTDRSIKFFSGFLTLPNKGWKTTRPECWIAGHVSSVPRGLMIGTTPQDSCPKPFPFSPIWRAFPFGIRPVIFAAPGWPDVKATLLSGWCKWQGLECFKRSLRNPKWRSWEWQRCALSNHKKKHKISPST